MCDREREQEKMCVRDRLCMCVSVRESMFECEKESVKVFVYIRVCVRERLCAV